MTQMLAHGVERPDSPLSQEVKYWLRLGGRILLVTHGAQFGTNSS